MKEKNRIAKEHMEKMHAVKKAGTRDMTSGSPLKLILSFSIPLIIGTIFQQLYGMVDTIIVGKFVGVNALAGVGSTGSISFLIIGFCTGVCSGFAVPVAQQFGARDEVGLRRYVAGAVKLSVVFAVVITIIVALLTKQILQWMNTPEDIFAYAYQYILIIFLGIPTVFLYNLTAAIIRALGDSKVPLYFLMLSAALNIILDLFFILVMKMGVSGAAIATVISQMISGICCLLYMKRKYPILQIEKGDWIWRPQYAARLCTMGVPMGLQFSVTAIGCLVLQASVNGLGAVAVASVTAGDKIHALLGCPLETMGVSMATYSGQNMGAGKVDRLTKGFKAVGILICIYSLLALGIQLLLGRQMLLLFLEPEETQIIEQARKYLIYMAITYIPLGFVASVRSMIQGMGFVSFSILSGVFEMVARMAVGIGLVPMFGFTAVCLAHPAAWVAADVFLIPAFFWCIKVVRGRMTFRGKNDNRRVD